MAVPKKKTTQSKRDMRRSHHALKKQALVKCQHCGKMKLNHHQCQACLKY